MTRHRPDKRYPRELTKRRQKRVERKPKHDQQITPFWFKRHAGEVRMAQMEKYRQMRPQPTPQPTQEHHYTMSYHPTTAWYDYGMTTASSRDSWGPR